MNEEVDTSEVGQGRRRHSYEPAQGHGLRHDPFNSIVAPRPIGWISTVDASGRRNLAPYSFFNAFNYAPPIVGFASIGWKDTVRNIEETGVFAWNLVTPDLAEAMNRSSSPVAADIDEFDLSGLESRSGDLIDVPLVAASEASFECRLSQIVRLRTAAGGETDSWLVLGEVVKIHIAQRLIVEGIFRTALAEPVLRGGGAGDYFTIDDSKRFFMRRPPSSPQSE